jgi:hypothetical protein
MRMKREYNLASGMREAPTIFENIAIFKGRQITRQAIMSKKVSDRKKTLSLSSSLISHKLLNRNFDGLLCINDSPSFAGILNKKLGLLLYMP